MKRRTHTPQEGRWNRSWRRQPARRRRPALALALAALLGLSAWSGWQLGEPASAGGSTASSGLFPCPSPNHHDGDAIRCAGTGRSMRLHGIDAPEMPGACRPGRSCTPGDPYAARDHLAALTRGRAVECRQVDTDHYGRRIVECRAGGVDLSCAMVRDGFAVARYGSLSCE